MKKITGALVLLFLMMSLATVLYMRTQHTVIGSADPANTGPEATASTADDRENSQYQTNLSDSEETGGSESEFTPASKPAPTPTPTPTPRPLRPVSVSDQDLPEELLLQAKHRGTVEEDDYHTRDMVSDLPYVIHKDVTVYLPYEYDPRKQYDVLILLHCAWADHRFWLAQDRNYGTEAQPNPVSVPNLLDRMIEEGYCRPLIVLSPCVYLYDRQPSNAGNGYDYTQFAKEYGKDFLPWVAENYATYAADSSPEALRDAREHFGILGASFGAYAAYASVIGDNFDLTAWYTFCGGGEIDPGYLMNCWAEKGTSELPLRMIYICEGEFDDRAGPELSYYNLVHTGGVFTEENVKFTLVQGWGHEDHSYLVGLYNTLQMFFRA